MKKFYHKKEATPEETPILLRLERRHTLMESAHDADKERRAFRANSVGSSSGVSSTVSTPVGQSKVPSNDKTMSDDKQSIFSRASTVVITESDLSSSWLYTNKKAQIAATSENEMDSRDKTASNSFENLIPETVEDPRLKSSLISTARPKKQTSCCCYLTIALFIGLATLGILAAIGGIVYMEVFTAYIEKSHHSTSEILRGHEKLWNGVVNTSAETVDSKRTENVTSENDKTAPFDVFDVAEIGQREKSESNTASKSGKEHPSEHESNSSVSIPKENERNRLQNQNDSSSVDVEDSNGSDGSREGTSNVSRNNGISLPKMATEMSEQDKLDLFMKYNDQTKKYFSNENQIPRELPVGTNSTSVTELGDGDFDEQELHNLEDSSNSDIDGMVNWSETNISDPNPDDPLQVQGQLAYLPFDNAAGTNNQNASEFDLPKEHRQLGFTTDHLNVHQEGMVTSGNESGKVSLSSDRSQIETDNSTQVAENVSESKSLPFEFFRRLGFDRASMIAHPALTVEDMNVRFSLAEALKYLRSLDENKPPTPRTKSQTVPQNNRPPKKMADVGKERKEYLMKLRENLLPENV